MSRNLLTGLVGAWCPSLGPSGYTLLDRSGRGNHGTLTNMDSAAWSSTAGGYALAFDGTNDYMLRTSESFRLSFPFTVSCWYRPRTRKVYSGIVSTMTAFDEVGTEGWRINDGALGLNSHLGMACGGVQIQAAASTLNEWQHIVAVFNGANSTLWRNSLVFVSGSLSTPNYLSTPKLKIGAWIESSGHNDMLIDDIGIFSRNLTQQEVAMMYTAGRGGLGRLLTQRTQRRVFRTATGNRRRRLICGAEC